VSQQARNLIMDLGEQAHRVTFMIRDRGPDFTAASGATLAGAGIQTVLCNARTPRMNAIAERWIGGCRRELLDRTLAWNQDHLRRILHAYEIHHNQHRPLAAAAPLKPLPEPVDLDQYRVRRRAHTACLINEYRLADDADEVFGTHKRRITATGESSGQQPIPRLEPTRSSRPQPTAPAPGKPTPPHSGATIEIPRAFLRNAAHGGRPDRIIPALKIIKNLLSVGIGGAASYLMRQVGNPSRSPAGEPADGSTARFCVNFIT
jgi:hypothetical protein